MATLLVGLKTSAALFFVLCFFARNSSSVHSQTEQKLGPFLDNNNCTSELLERDWDIVKNRTTPTTNCCLTKLCSHRNSLIMSPASSSSSSRQSSTNNDEVVDNYPVGLQGLYCKLCKDKFHLTSEFLAGCRMSNNDDSAYNSGVKRNTNLDDASLPGIIIRSMEEIEAHTNKVCVGTKFRTSYGNQRKRMRNSNEVRGMHKPNIRSIQDAATDANPVNSGNAKKEGPEVDDKRRKIRLGNITENEADGRMSSSSSSSLLQFLDVPKGDEMRIQNLNLDDDYFLFKLLSGLIDYLHPREFPVELMRDTIQNQVPFHTFALQVQCALWWKPKDASLSNYNYFHKLLKLLKTEFSVVGWILSWAVLTLCLPITLLVHRCCTNRSIRRLNEEASDAVSLDYRGSCERTIGFLLHLLLILMLLPIIAILAGNEQISKYLARSTSLTNTIFEDVNTFIKNTHMQISFVATSSMDMTVEAIRKDLENVRELLGKPYQQDLANETGLDLALDALTDLKETTGEITWLLSDLMKECSEAHAAGALLQERLNDIARQLSNLRQQCLPKDRALCYTLQYSGLDVLFSCANLTVDPKIKQLEHIGTEKAFNKSVDEARMAYEGIPELVFMRTAANLAELKNILNRKRTAVYKSAHNLDELTRYLLDTTISSHDVSQKAVRSISEWDMVIWIVILGICTILSITWGLLLCGAPCGYPGSAPRTTRFLLTGVTLASFMSLVLWALGTSTLLVGGHSQSLVCRPLYDQPRYTVLGQLLNTGGILYPVSTTNGSSSSSFFKAFAKGNDTLNVEDVLRSCQRDRPAYSTFHLSNFFDVQSLTNYRYWSDFKSVLSNLTFRNGAGLLEILSPSLQLNLQSLSTISMVNLTKYRSDMLAPLTRKDLNSFVDQLNAVSRQLLDLSSSTRIDNLAMTVKKVVRNEWKTLSALRESILYKITALEVLIQPISRQANHSLAHLKNVQYFLDSQGWMTAERNQMQFTLRIESYLNALHNHTHTMIREEIGKCQPLWEIFQKSRHCFCKLLVNPTNGISLSSFFLILLFLAIFPIVFKLSESYREIDEEFLSSVTHRRARDGLAIDDEGTWVTPSETPDIEMRSSEPHYHHQRHQSEPQVWVSPSPRQPSAVEYPIPPPPPRVSTIGALASRISATRVPQIPSVSRSRTPKRRQESLRLIEPVCWKNGSVSPRSWM